MFPPGLLYGAGTGEGVCWLTESADPLCDPGISSVENRTQIVIDQDHINNLSTGVQNIPNQAGNESYGATLNNANVVANPFTSTMSPCNYNALFSKCIKIDSITIPNWDRGSQANTFLANQVGDILWQMEMWVAFNTMPTNSPFLSQYTGGFDRCFFWRVSQGGSGGLRFGITHYPSTTTNASAAGHTFAEATAVQTGEWHHLFVQCDPHDADAQEWALWVDGVFHEKVPLIRMSTHVDDNSRKWGFDNGGFSNNADFYLGAFRCRRAVSTLGSPHPVRKIAGTNFVPPHPNFALTS